MKIMMLNREKVINIKLMAYAINQLHSSLSSPVKIKSLKEENGNDVVKFDLKNFVGRHCNKMGYTLQGC